jgi:hypothetical protein
MATTYVNPPANHSALYVVDLKRFRQVAAGVSTSVSFTHVADDD